MPRVARRHRDACERSAANLIQQAAISTWPVSLDKVASHLGISVRKVPMIDDLSGMCFYKNGIPIVVVNANQYNSRQRFSIAHEIGHVVLHQTELRRNAFVDKNITVLHRDKKASSGKIQVEVEANHFAAALLMPRQMIYRYMEEYRLRYGLRDDEKEIQKMAQAFEVSTTALAIRLGNVLS